MNSLFTHIPQKRPRRSFFDLGHEKKMSFAPGRLIPILLQETVPGDKFRCNAEIALQFAPMLAPLMHRVDVVTRFFFVPMRLIWPNFNKEFISGGPDGVSTLQCPTIDYGQAYLDDGSSFGDAIQEGTLMDYFGLKPLRSPDEAIGHQLTGYKINALPFRAYQLIYDEYFRNQNSEDESDYGNLLDTVGDRSQLLALTQLRRLNWQHDYFTSTLPWTQRGNPVTVPITGTGQIDGLDIPVKSPPAGLTTILETVDGSPLDAANRALLIARLSDPTNAGQLFTSDALNLGAPDQAVKIGGINGLTGMTASSVDPISVELQNAGITIESLRRTARLQEWLEKNARAGARYIEQIIAHFGVRSSDARLQRPEYLGGGRQLVQVSNVLQTSSTAPDSPQANPSGYGSAYGMSNRFKYFCEEHGYLLGVMYVMPKTAYEQGVPRLFNHIDRFDYYFPEFAHLGEQPVYKSELYLDNTTSVADANAIFGYTPRYAEYKSALSSIHGQMRSSLDFWHWGRKFVSMPGWSNSFMQYTDDRRIFNVEEANADPIFAHLYLDLKAKRPMPKFGVPYL